MLIEQEILPKQAEFMRIEDIIAGVFGGFGSGKTNIVGKWFCDRLMSWPLGTHAIANKDLGQYKRGTIVTVKDELNSRGIKYTYNNSDGILRIRKNGATILPLSAENYETWRALEADTIWADELTTWGPSAEKAFLEFLIPRRRLSPEGVRYRERGHKLQAMLRFSSNPPTDTAHWTYDLIVRKKFCPVIYMATYDNYLMKDLEQYVYTLKKAYPPDLWPILLGGNWGNATQGTTYKGFSLETHSVSERTEPLPVELPPFKLNEDEPLAWMLDFNVGLMCSVVGQWQIQKYRAVGYKTPELFRPISQLEDIRERIASKYPELILYVLDEIRLPDAGSPDVVEEFLKRYLNQARRRGVRIYGDSSGGARSQTMAAMSSARSNWAIILSMLQRYNVPYDFRVPSQNPSVMDRINAVKLQLSSIDGPGLFLDTEKTGYTIQDLVTVRYKPGTNDIDKENLTITHLSDALGYGVWLERTLSVGEKIDFKSEREI